MQRSLKNIKLSTFQKFLEFKGLKKIRTTGGHEVWSRADLTRPVIIQSHIDPIPDFVIKSNLRTMNTDKQELIEFLTNQ